MQLLVISCEHFIEHETSIINHLFEHNLSCLHLRKPHATIDEYRAILNKIKPEFYSKIALHQYHILAKDYGINRIHFTEKGRECTHYDKLESLKNEGNILSTSIHNVNDIGMLKDIFNYSFLSPVFDSISKPDYKGIINKNFNLKTSNKSTPIIALGGINNLNINLIKKYNFSGAALLGYIWNEPQNAVNAFTKL